MSQYPFSLRTQREYSNRRGGPMTENTTSWVVYKMTLPKQPKGMNAVCEQGEWYGMGLARPGYHTLRRAGIASEGGAERIARGTSGDTPQRQSREGVLQQLADAEQPVKEEEEAR